MRSTLSWILLGAATTAALLPPLLTQAQPAPTATAQQVTVQPSVGDLTITLQGLEARLLPVAVPALRGAAGDQIAAVVSNDLRLSALFRVLDPHSFTADLDAEGLNINAPSWATVGATAVVKGAATGSGDATRVELRVWEPGSPAAPRLTRSYGPASPRALAHRIANDLIQLYTQTPGVFGTRIAFARRTGRGRKAVFTVDCDGENLAQVSGGSTALVHARVGPRRDLLLVADP
jgi:Tol biopolymer transport system component